MRRSISGFLIIIFLASTVMCALNVRTVRAIGTIYIRADGSVDPSTAPISTLDNVTYTLTGNITSDADGIVVERDNIVLNGAGYVITGGGSGNGTTLTDRSNVTISNITMKDFQYGIVLYFSYNNTLSSNNVTGNLNGIELDSSSDNVLSGNNITANNAEGIEFQSSSSNAVSDNNVANNGDGIILDSSCDNNTLSGNDVANNYVGIYFGSSCDNNTLSGNNLTANNLAALLYYSSGNTLYGNNVTNSSEGIQLGASDNNILSGNNITAIQQYGIILASCSSNTLSDNSIADNGYGILLRLSSDHNILFGNNITTNNAYGIVLDASDNSIFHNNFVDNSGQVQSLNSSNTWDDSYPSGGNYWSDYNGTDLYSGLFQNIPGSDRIGDTPYVIDANNTDRYPLMNPWAPPEYDVAISNALPLKTVVGLGYSMNISVTAINQGEHAEAFNVTVYVDTTITASQNVTLSIGDSATIVFTWNTTGFAYGNYTLSAYAWPVPNETDTANNNFTCTVPVHVGAPGDVSGAFAGNYDGVVAMRDIAYMIMLFNTRPSSPNWNPNADVNNDGVCNMRDIAIAVMNYGKRDFTA